MIESLMLKNAAMKKPNYQEGLFWLIKKKKTTTQPKQKKNPTKKPNKSLMSFVPPFSFLTQIEGISQMHSLLN